MTLLSTQIADVYGALAVERYGAMNRIPYPARLGGEQLVETFTRTGEARYTDPGFLEGLIAADGVPRYGYVDGEYYVLLEDLRTQLIARSDDLSHVDWTLTNVTISGTQTIVETTANADHNVGQTITSSGGIGSLGVEVRQGTGLTKRPWVWIELGDATDFVRGWFNIVTGAIGGTAVGGTGVVGLHRIEDISSSSKPTYRVMLGGSGLPATMPIKVGIATFNNATSYTGLVTADLDVGIIQGESQASPSSGMRSLGVSINRNLDSLTFPFYLTAGAPFSIYTKLINLQYPDWPGGGNRIVFAVGLGTGRRFQLFNLPSDDQYQLAFTDTSVAFITHDFNPVYGDILEFVAHFIGDGSVQLFTARNGGSVTASVVSNIVAIAGEEWSARTISVGGLNAAQTNMMGLRAMIPAAGLHSMADYRSAMTALEK